MRLCEEWEWSVGVDSDFTFSLSGTVSWSLLSPWGYRPCAYLQGGGYDTVGGLDRPLQAHPTHGLGCFEA